MVGILLAVLVIDRVQLPYNPKHGTTLRACVASPHCMLNPAELRRYNRGVN